VQTGRALVEAGLHPATGGDGSLACSGDMLLQALVACAGVTLRSVATNRGLDVTGTVRADGDLDFRGTMGVARDAPVGFRAIRLHFDLTSGASEEDLAALIRRPSAIASCSKRWRTVPSCRSRAAPLAGYVRAAPHRLRAVM
jgi:uncharacterized OsmC-like protein